MIIINRYNLINQQMEKFNTIFNKFREDADKFESLFTIISYNLTINETVNKLDHYMKLINTIKDMKRKIYLNDRIYKFKEFLQQKSTIETETINVNSVFLISNDINEIPLETKWIEALKEFDINKFIFKYNSNFEIDYLKCLLIDTDYKHVIFIKNNEMKHIYFTDHKKKVHHESKNIDIKTYVDKEIKETCIIHGISPILKSLKIDKHLIFSKCLKDEEISLIFKKENMRIIHASLEEYFGYISNPKKSHQIIFGKEIEKKIVSKELAKIFCSSEMYQKLLDKVPKQYFTFKLIQVDSLEKGDVGDKLKVHYGGMIAVTYY